MLNGPANLSKIHGRKRDKSYSTDPYLPCRQILSDGIELHQDRYLSMRKLSTLSTFGNLPYGVFFSVDLFSRCRGPMNFMGAVALETLDSIS